MLTLQIADMNFTDPIRWTFVGGRWSTFCRHDRPRTVLQPTLFVQNISQSRNHHVHSCREVILCAPLPFKGLGGASRDQQQTSNSTKVLAQISLEGQFQDGAHSD